MVSEFANIPDDMRKVYRRFERWRSGHAGRMPIPERLWVAAAELARGHGVFPTAQALRLEYGKLKQRVEAAGPVAKGRVAKARAALRQSQDDERQPHRQRGGTAVLRRARSRSGPPAFVELMAPGPGSSPECRVELEGPRGRMRIECKGIALAELVELSRVLWDGEA